LAQAFWSARDDGYAFHSGTHLDKEKNTMSSATLFRISGIILLLGAMLSVVAGVLTLFLDISLSASPRTIQSPLWSTFWSLTFVAIVLVLLGLPAFYLRQARGRGGLLGLIGVFLVALGSFLGMATTTYFVSIAPLLAAKAPNLINAGYETSLAVFGISATTLGIIGPLLLGIAVIRAKVFPSLVGILLMVSGVPSPVTTFSSGVLFALIGLVGIVSAAIAYGWVGRSLTQQHNVEGAEVVSSVEAALH
jgi:hypothetical protein